MCNFIKLIAKIWTCKVAELLGFIRLKMEQSDRVLKQITSEFFGYIFVNFLLTYNTETFIIVVWKQQAEFVGEYQKILSLI